jgi:D-arabinono-1,4-lactone oxidase
MLAFGCVSVAFGSELDGAPLPARGRDGFFHPKTEDELRVLVRRARASGVKLRVRGSAHSVARAIYTDGARNGGHFDVMLDRYARVVEFNDPRMRVTVQAGCHLGRDPRDPTGSSTWENSLLSQLEARGWALPDLGGVTHQTVSGFLLTGSCGGSVVHAIEDAIIALRLIDGTGAVHSLEREHDPLFFAALCSMGLLGVISTITLQCVPAYDIVGREDITSESDCAYDLFGDDERGLEGFLRTAEYARLMWWPQEHVRRVVTWQARRMRAGDYAAPTGPRDAFRPKPYSVLGDAIAAPRIARTASVAGQALGGMFYDALALASPGSRARARLSRLRSVRWAIDSPLGRRARTFAGDAFVHRMLPAVLRQFVPLGKPQHFWDRGCVGLPMDNQMSEASLPTEFTEIWVPLERTGEVLRRLRAHYDRGGYEATGAFICEIYAARATRAWMHPGYERDSLRIDLFWFARNPGDPARGWFVQFWELLRPFGYRLHWGKHLPADPDLGSRHLRRHTPRWDDFLAVRARLDPGDVFLTPYWRDALGIGAATRRETDVYVNTSAKRGLAAGR